MKIRFTDLSGVEQVVVIEKEQFKVRYNNEKVTSYSYGVDGEQDIFVACDTSTNYILVGVKDSVKCNAEASINGCCKVQKIIIPDYMNIASTDMEIDLDSNSVLNLLVKDINGNDVPVRNSLLNNLIINADAIEFNDEYQIAYVDSLGYNFKLSPEEVKIEGPDGKTKGSSASAGYGSRNAWVAIGSQSNRVSLSRLWCIVKAMHYKALPLYELDEWVHNHKDNKGKAEAEIAGFSGLDCNNYELCTVSENKAHGDAWNKVYNTLGIELRISAIHDKELIKCINSLETQKVEVLGKKKFKVDPEILKGILKTFGKYIE